MKKLIFGLFLVVFFISFASAVGNFTQFVQNQSLEDENFGTNANFMGVNITLGGQDLWIYSINKTNLDGATRGRIFDMADTVLATCTFSGNNCVFSKNIKLSADTRYRIASDGGGGSITRYREDSVGLYPRSDTYWNWTGGNNNGVFATDNAWAGVNAINASNVNPKPIAITLDFPDANNATEAKEFNFTIDLGIDLINSTVFIWNTNNNTLVTSLTESISGGNTTINDSITFTTLPVGKYKWGMEACGTNSTTIQCSGALVNNTFTYGYKLNGITFPTPATEVSEATFTLNVTLASGLTSSSAVLNYNNSILSSAKTTVAGNTIFSNMITLPQVSGSTAKNFNYTIQLIDLFTTQLFNTTTQTQTINDLGIDDCSVNTILLLNYTLFDEDTRTLITTPTQNSTIEVDLTLAAPTDISNTIQFSINKSNVNNLPICLENSLTADTEYRLDAVARYFATDRVVEFNYIQNASVTNSTIPITVDLYDLLITSSQEFIITVKDENFVKIPNAIVDITRQFISLGVFTTVEVPRTDADGRTPAHLVLSDATYTIFVKKEGKLLSTFENIKPFCASATDCSLSLNAAGSSSKIKDFKDELNIRYVPRYNSTTRVYEFEFTSTDSLTKTVNLTIDKIGGLGTTVCSQQITSSSGTLICPLSTAGNGTAIATVTVGGTLLLKDQIQLLQSVSDIIPAYRYILAFILIITLPLFAIASAPIALVFFIIGLVFASTLFLIDGGGIFGATSGIIWLIVAAIILIWKATRGRENFG